MRSHRVKSGFVGVSVNSDINVVLLQCTSEHDQARCGMTIDDAKFIISQLEEAIKRIENNESKR